MPGAVLESVFVMLSSQILTAQDLAVFEMRWKDSCYLGYSSCLAEFIHVIKNCAVEK